MQNENPLVNVRIARRIRTAQGALIRVEVGGGWIVSEGDPLGLIPRAESDLIEFQSEEPDAGWQLEFRGSERDWHTAT